jgi:hypothetical protein
MVMKRGILNQTKESIFSAMLEVNPVSEPFDADLGMAKMLRPELQARSDRWFRRQYPLRKSAPRIKKMCVVTHPPVVD